ncbi:MAG TPA: RebB family R body protein [Thermoanaerobaculia bacterium]|jgi:hypothetical protein
MAKPTQQTSPDDEIPRDVVLLCRAFASCLDDLNKVQQQQMEGIVDIVVEILEAAREICGEEASADANDAAGKLKPVAEELEAVLEKQAKAAKSAGQAAQEALAKAAAPDSLEPQQPVLELVKAITQALGKAADNAVQVQHQGAVIFQAAVTQGVSTLYSLATACIAKDARKK